MDRRFVVIAVVACSFGQSSAAILFESSALGVTGNTSGFVVASTQILAARFSLTQTAEVSAVGGNIGGGEIFAAILRMSGPTSLPSGSPFDDSTLAATLLTPGLASDVIVPLNVRLAPGDYALVFGSGYYGATGNGYMPFQNIELSTPETYFHWRGEFLPHGWRTDGGTQATRFVVYGEIVPEPSTAVMGIMGGAALTLACARRASTRKGATIATLVILAAATATHRRRIT